jgi:hypothetical protein
LTQNSTLVHCLHDYANQDPIEAEGFGTHPKQSHRIIHTFSGFDAADLDEGDIVTAPDLAATLPDNTVSLERLRNRAGRLVVCVGIEQLRSQRRLWRWLRSRSGGHYLTLDKGGERIAVVELSTALDGCNGIDGRRSATATKEVQVARF